MIHHRLRSFSVTCGLAAGLAFVPATFAAASAPATADTQGMAPLHAGASQVRITLTGGASGDACVLDHDTAKAGPVTFRVTNQTATAISEVEVLDDHRILGEKENLAPGLPAVTFTTTLDGGDYQIYCPGARRELQTFIVKGEAKQATGDVAALLQHGATGYARYVDGMSNALVTAVARLKATIDASNLDAARAQYAHSRIFYERIESDVEGFVLPGYKVTDNAGSLDYLIDMRASSLDPKVGWHGFHAIGRDLFKYDRIDAGTRQLAAELLHNVKRLRKVAKTLHYRPEDLANGAAALLEEVLSTKVTGEEEAFSHIDLVDFAGNVEGARQAFAFLKPGMMKIDPVLTHKVAKRFQAVNRLLDHYRDPNALGGYVRYTASVRTPNAAKLSHAIQALQAPLSRIAAKVATVGIL